MHGSYLCLVGSVTNRLRTYLSTLVVPCDRTGNVVQVCLCSVVEENSVTMVTENGH